MHELIDCFTFYEDRIQSYYNILSYTRRQENDRSLSNLKSSGGYKGQMTQSGKRLIKKRLTAWFTAQKIKNKLNSGSGKIRKHNPIFFTLTMSDDTILDHREIKRQLMQNYIKQLRYNGDLQEYFWKAELQKNGRIHFHFVGDTFIKKEEIQRRWNVIQRKNGLLINFEKKYGHDNPPSTHVRGIKDLKRSISYVMKYVSKEETAGEISGGTFRFSKKLLELKPFNIDDTELDLYEFKEKMTNETWRSYSNDFVNTEEIITDNFFETLPVKLQRKYDEYYLNIYDELYAN